MSRQPLFTIGYSTRSVEEFVGLLKQYNVERLVDIRTIPKSRHNPQYGMENLKQSLDLEGITYTYVGALGGLRPAAKVSHNTAWRNKSFRNYADYMQIDEFSIGLEELIEYHNTEVTAIMCAEAVPWRCHRSLVADALVARNIRVCEVIGSVNAREHMLTSFAKVEGDRVTYPGESSFTEEESYA